METLLSVPPLEPETVLIDLLFLTNNIRKLSSRNEEIFHYSPLVPHIHHNMEINKAFCPCVCLINFV